MTLSSKNSSKNFKQFITDVSENKGQQKSNLPVLAQPEFVKKMNVDGHVYEVKLTNPEILYFPENGYKKRELLEYYENVSDIMLPYLYDRPLIVERYPQGIHNKGFFQNEFTETPSYTTLYKHTTNYFSQTSYVVCQNLPTLMYLANKASISFHPWLSKLTSIQKPDFAVLELVPYNTNFEKVVAVALEIREILDQMEIKPLVKTSGVDSLHIYIPLENMYSYHQTLNFAKLIALVAHKRMPSITTVENYHGYRKNKVFLDYTQNIIGKTSCAPYSVITTHSAAVSTPITWDEVNTKLNPKAFNIKSIPLRLKEKGDIWKSVYNKEGINMIEILEQWAF